MTYFTNRVGYSCYIYHGFSTLQVSPCFLKYGGRATCQGGWGQFDWHNVSHCDGSVTIQSIGFILLWLLLGCAHFAKKNFSLISETKMRIWIPFTCVSQFHYKISLLFFCFLSLIFASNFSLRFTLVIFALKRNKAKRNSGLFNRFFSLNFRFTLIFSLNFRLFYLRFRFRFLVFRIEVKHVKSGFFCSKRK